MLNTPISWYLSHKVVRADGSLSTDVSEIVTFKCLNDTCQKRVEDKATTQY